MRKSLLILPLIFAFYAGYSQTKAVTETGEEVLLYDDGTWEYSGATEEEISAPIATNPATFSKPADAKFLVKSAVTNLGVWINSKSWSFTKSKENSASEYEFQAKGKDLYAMMISERIEIPLESLRKIALENGRGAAPDIKIVSEEYRKVNDQTILCLQMNGTIEGIKFTYYGYYFSSPEGTVQFISYTSQNLFEQYKKDMESLLNGLAKQ